MTPQHQRYVSEACSMPEIDKGPHVLGWKRVYDPPASGDGLRALIDRLWPRGMRKEDLKYDAWWKDLAPSTELRKWFGHDPARWEEFRGRYAAELAEHPEAIGTLCGALKRSPVTLLTSTKDQYFNHAVALLDIAISSL